MQYFKIPIKFDPSVVMYLVIIDKAIRDYTDMIKVRPSEKFFEMIGELVTAYVINSKEPPPQIATAIMNIADDMMSCRDVTIRAGDYISLMQYARQERNI